MAKGEPSERARAFVRWMKANNTNTHQVALASGVTYNTLASFVQGDTQSLKGENEEKIVTHYNESASVIFGGKRPVRARPERPSVPLLGLVGAGAPIEAIQRDDPDSVEVPLGFDDYEAYRVKGRSCRPVFEDGDIVIVRSAASAGHFLNRYCVVLAADGNGYLKRVAPRRGDPVPGQGDEYRLLGSDEGEDVQAQAISWAKPVVMRILGGSR